MNSSVVAKVMGWGQFGLNTFQQVAANGFPHNAVGWLSLLGSLAMAFGLHSAASTDGTK